MKRQDVELLGYLADTVEGIAKNLSSRTTQNNQLEAFGNWGSLGRMLAASLGDTLQRPLLFVTAHVPDADAAQDDLETFLGRYTHLFPALETTRGTTEITSETAGERLRLCQMLAYDKPVRIAIAASVQALMQSVPARSFLHEHSLKLKVGDEPPNGPAGIVDWLIESGYNRIDQVDVVGDCAARGGIVDIFPPGRDQPIRIEFFGDMIDSIRLFDIDTQRSTQSIREIALAGCKSGGATDQQSTFFDYLPKDTLLIFEEPSEITELGRIFRDRLEDERGIYTVESVLAQSQNFDTLYVNRFCGHCCQQAFDLAAQSLQRFENRQIDALNELTQAAQAGQQVFLYCENTAERLRVEEIITADKKKGRQKQTLPKNFHLPVGFVHQGFALPAAQLMVLSHHEVFGQHLTRRRIRRIKTTQAIDTFTDLEVNDLVVHVTHGIGKYRGIKVLEKNQTKEEYLTIEYADNALVHVPAGKIDLVHKYVGSARLRPKLSKLGSKSWEKQKQKVSVAVEDMAGELLEIQAQRQTLSGICYPADTIWQQEFEEAFPYEPTDDQVTTSQAIKGDMQQRRPMDRLLCGDVGYGKTELAIRAAFKAVEYGKQVAVLVPTTVLAEQHYRTFTERLADFPFIVESISRFKTAREAKNIVERARKGQVDILIGTHRILSEDVSFKDLGLIVIDEEQRFGVEHKERLKRIRSTVDILTMTATPIPRTLHMALLGIRDISSLTTPPLDRRSIVTEVCRYDEKHIREILLRELNRQGQAYFLHNRVQSIQSMADKLRTIIPEARMVVGHGQMSRRELEEKMLTFVNKQADILVCTTIIESGLDIPNANTIIVNDADRFGLAELHQLRGRVGRYKNRAYAYMLLPQRRPVNPTAVKRLKAIEEYSQLGSGFRIAMRDLEIRGAGNILGVEQSGHIDAVGYEMYCQLLAAAVRRRQGQPEPIRQITHLEMNFDCHIPRSYISSDRQRLDVYRRLATCQSSQDLEQLEKDLIDLFGKIPDSVSDLLSLAEIRVLAARWKIRSIVEQPPDLVFNLDDRTDIDRLFAQTAGSVRRPDARTVHLRLSPNYFQSRTTLLAVLRKILAREPA